MLSALANSLQPWVNPIRAAPPRSAPRSTEGDSTRATGAARPDRQANNPLRLPHLRRKPVGVAGVGLDARLLGRRAMVITTKILGEMERNNHTLGLVSLCIGGGQGIAMLLQRD
jgi:acetyl-CoA acetyltransferase